MMKRAEAQSSRQPFDSELILAKLTVDHKRRLFVSKRAGAILDIMPGDELVLSKREGREALELKVQRSGHVSHTLLLTPADRIYIQ